jgi:NAD(P)H-dependent flavin oxidoreductase YrpB (nitropropane dioxygenase family)
VKHRVDAIICQGGEAGGHCLCQELGNSTMALASQVKRNTSDIPTNALGGGGGGS